MSTLDRRLASLRTALPKLRDGLRPLPTPPSSFSGTNGQPGHSVTEQLIPLHSRAWLDRLPGADPQAAALLAPNGKTPIPPLSEWLFLDLETTGLAGGTGTYAFLVGTGRLVTEGFRICQFFLRDLGAEAELLTEVAPLLERASLLVTYNGKLFDAPLLETRYRLARRPSPLDALPHLDVLYPARRLWKQRFGSARLTNLEREVLRHERPEDIPGELIPQLYFDYLRQGDEGPLQIVFRHNADDLVTLAALAARLLELAAAPEQAASEPLELLAAARLFERAQKLDRARWLYEHALADSLPDEAARAGRWRLARLVKRQRDYARAARLWAELADDGAGKESLAALEELAICYEHRLRDLGAAREVTRRAIGTLDSLRESDAEDGAAYRRARVRFAHRLGRLTRKRHNGLLAPPVWF